MKVLVTGANGFLANNIIRELNMRQISVKGMVRKTSNLISLNGANYEKVIGDLNSFDELQMAVSGCDVIIHAAANTSQSHIEQINSSDHIGTTNVINVAEANDLKKVIFVSSANTFGFGSKDFPGAEDNEMHNLFKRSKYAINKLSSQNMILEAVNQGRIHATVVNPSFMIGPYDAKPSSGKILLMYLNNKLALCPPGGKSFVHVNDVAKASCNAIEMGKNGACYLLTGENLTYRQFFQKVQEVTHIARPNLNVNQLILKKLGRLGSFINAMGGNIELNYVNAELLNSHKFYTSKKAIRDLHMPQTSIEEAIYDAFHWFMENNYLKLKTASTHA